MAEQLDWRSRKFWIRAGWISTVLWVLLVLAISKGDSSHPIRDYIFLVPLAGWIIGLFVAHLIKRRFGPETDPATNQRDDKP